MYRCLLQTNYLSWSHPPLLDRKRRSTVTHWHKHVTVIAIICVHWLGIRNRTTSPSAVEKRTIHFDLSSVVATGAICWTGIPVTLDKYEATCSGPDSAENPSATRHRLIICASSMVSWACWNAFAQPSAITLYLSGTRCNCSDAGPQWG